MFSRLIILLTASSFVLTYSDVATAKDIVSPIDLLMKHQPNTDGSRAKNKSLKKLNLSLTKTKCEEIERSLFEAYGPATRSRGNLRIWQIPNTENASGQSKMVTIIAGEEDGRYFAKLDRQGFAASNNPRLRKKLTRHMPKPNRQHQSKDVNKSYERD